MATDTPSTTYDLAVRGGELHTATTHYPADVYVTNGQIVLIAPHGSGLPAAREIDAQGLDVLPGLWHTHCHFRDPGFPQKEDFASGTKAAALGGITFCIEQPNTQPLPVTVEAFQQKADIASSKAYVDFGINGGGLIPDQVGPMSEAGAISIKVFNTRHVKDAYPYIPELNVTDHAQLFQILEAGAASDTLISIHPDDADWARFVVQRDYINQGKIDQKAYAEAATRGYMYGDGMVVGIMTAAYYAELAGARLYCLHTGLMGVRGFKAVRDAKADRQTPLYAEMELSSITLTPEWAAKVGPKVFHTGREPKSELWRAVHDGTADTLVLEHAPHTLDEIKDGWNDHFTIPLGETGVQEMVPMLLTEVNKGNLSLQDVVRLCSQNPADIFRIPRKGRIQPGADADLTIVDMNKSGVFRDEDMASKTGFSSWAGMEYTAAPVYTVVRGEIVMQNGDVVGSSGYGKIAGPKL